MKESVLIRAIEVIWLHVQSSIAWKNLDATLAALAVMIFLRAKTYHRLRQEVFEISGTRLSMYGVPNMAFCYLFFVCAGIFVFQIVSGMWL